MPDEALRRLDRAVGVDPSYPDARFFRGMVLRSKGDPPGAIAELRTYLDLSPEGPMSDQVETVLKAMEKEALCLRSRPDRRYPASAGPVRYWWFRSAFEHPGQGLIQGVGAHCAGELGHDHAPLVHPKVSGMPNTP